MKTHWCNLVFLILFFIIVSFGLPTKSQATPNFARQYGADCTMCHTAVPMLNRFGYEFRAAGYRDPAEIGKENKGFDLGNLFAARLQTQYQYVKTNNVGTADTSSSQLTFKEFTMYPLTGSWGKYFGSLSELSVSPDDNWEIENAYVRGVYPSKLGFLEGRIGVFHSWEGFGAGDRQLGNLRTLFQTTAATGSPFLLWSQDEVGAELGYYFTKTGTMVSGVIWNGINADGKSAQGGNLTKTSGAPGSNDKDFQFLVNQFIRDDAAVSVYYYHGVVPFPATGTQTRDTYQRLAAYANFYPIKDKVNLIGGYEYGNDSLADKTVTGGANVGKSDGFFGGAQYFVIPAKLAIGVRYDFFDPSKKVSHNGIDAVDLSVNYMFKPGLQLVTDYQHKDTNVTTGGTKKNDTLQARVIVIF